MSAIPTLMPWIETIPLLRSQQHTLFSARRQNLYYSSPQATPIHVVGFQLVYSAPGPTAPEYWLQVCESQTPDTWSPFFYAPARAIAGFQNNGVYPVVPLPEPYLLQPFKRLQISLKIFSGSFTPGTRDSINLVGVREIGGAAQCSS